MDPTMKHQFDENQRKISRQETTTLKHQGKVTVRINTDIIYYVEWENTYYLESYYGEYLQLREIG